MLIQVIYMNQLVVVVHIMRTVESVFRVDLCLEFRIDLFDIGALHERVRIPYPFAASPYVVYDSPRDTSFGIVIVELKIPSAIAHLAIQSSL